MTKPAVKALFVALQLTIFATGLLCTESRAQSTQTGEPEIDFVLAGVKAASSKLKSYS